jgi:NADH-ubiquinone oxidoreductase chain 4L
MYSYIIKRHSSLTEIRKLAQLVEHPFITWKVKRSNHLFFFNTQIFFIFYTMNLSLILFTIGILGFVLNRKNIILMLISIEIMLLAITFLVLVSSLSFDDILGQTYAIYIIAIAGAESAIGLGILVAFYRLRGSISIEFK